MSNKINPKMIIDQHIDTLYDNSGEDQKISKWDVLFFFGLPLVISGILIGLKQLLDSNASNSLLVSLSIFTPLLLNLLILIYDMGQKAVEKERANKYIGDYELEIKRLKEITANISFSILISIFAIIILVLYSLNIWDNIYWISLLNGIIYYLGGIFILTLLMVLKRTHALISKSFS